uniref:Uncharacterized protein n=1 Tax=Romanomermis culicivorax TaxID=13658 RepID=A0A915IAD3_ROMCU
MAVRYILQCLTDTKVRNYPAIEEKKQIICDIHREYQIEMDKHAESKKKKSSVMMTQPAVPLKYQMKLALLIIMTTTMQAPTTRIQTSLGAAQ